MRVFSQCPDLPATQPSPSPPSLQAVLTVSRDGILKGTVIYCTRNEPDAPLVPNAGFQRAGGEAPQAAPPPREGRTFSRRSNLEPEHICSQCAYPTAWQTRRDGSQSLTGCQVLQMMELKIARYR